jgi:hypothetical protein
VGEKMSLKIIALILTTLLVTATIVISSASSQEYTTISINPKDNLSLIDEIFTINVTITNVTNLNGWQIALSFDPSVLNCTKILEPPDSIFAGHATIGLGNNTATPGLIICWNALFAIGDKVSGSGTLCQIKFKGLSEGTSHLNFINVMQIQLNGTFLLDHNYNSIPFHVVNGTAKITVSSKSLSVPFYYQIKTYYSGPAALEMVFDYYGENIDQYEIADVARTFPNVTYTDELRRAGHFSNISTSKGQELTQNITGYTLRKLGYGAFEKTGLTLQQLRTLVAEGYPIIVLTWYDLSKQRSHYRIVVGYNSTHMILHDPWNKNTWGGEYGGSNIALSYATFTELWEYSNNWALFVRPWKITINGRLIKQDTFNITATVEYTCPLLFQDSSYIASACNATIILPSGLSLGEGETAKKTLGTGTMVPNAVSKVSWIIVSPTPNTAYTAKILVEGKINGHVNAHGNYPSYDYTDRIGGEIDVPILRGPDGFGDITGANGLPDRQVDMRDIAVIAFAFGSSPGHPRWNQAADITGSTPGVPDGKVDMRDIAAAAKNFGKKW